jgi:hypothetical protein
MDDIDCNNDSLDIYKIALVYYCILFIILAITCVRRNFRPIELPANCMVVLFYIITSSLRLFFSFQIFMLKSMDTDDGNRKVDLLMYLEYVIGCNIMFCNMKDCLGIHDDCIVSIKSSSSSSSSSSLQASTRKDQFVVIAQYTTWAFLSSMISNNFFTIKSLCVIFSCMTFFIHFVPLYFHLYKLRIHFKNPKHFQVHMPFLYINGIYIFSCFFLINWIFGPDYLCFVPSKYSILMNVLLSMMLKSLSLIYVIYDLHIPFTDCYCPSKFENETKLIISTLSLST